MKRETKLWLRKWALMRLSAIVWRLDDWVHAQQEKLREELSVPIRMEKAGPARPQGPTVSCPFPFPADELVRRGIRGRAARLREPQRASKTQRRRGTTAAEFDLRFAR